MNQVAIAPINGYVRKEYLHDLDPQYIGQWAPCTVIGICSYKGELPTLKLRVIDGSLWDYIPFDAFSTAKVSCSDGVGRAQLTPDNCPAHTLTFQTFPTLTNESCKIWMKGLPQPGPHPATFIGVVDWPDANYSGNLVMCGTQLALVPNYRLLVGSDVGNELPKDYKKLRSIFTA